MLNQSLYYKIR